MKAIKILFMSVFLVFLISIVSAVVVYAEWDDNNAQLIEIESQGSTDFSVYFGTMSSSMTINIDLYSGNSLVYSFEDNKVINQNSFGKTYTINENIYSRPGNFQIKIIGSDNLGEMTHIISLVVANNPPVITSVPITEVNEKESYEYQMMATDSDGHTLTYSLSQAPAWLSINSGSGLITGTAPEVSEDTDFDVSVIVSDSTDTDTQSYTLTVKYVPEPFLSQTVELVEDVKVDYYATLSELDSAVLEVYYGTSLIATRNINAPSYSETFDFYNIHEKTKGDYSFILEAVGYDLSETDEITIRDYASEVDLSSIPDNEKNFNEEASIQITLPVPTDKNPEDNPVAYISATSLDNIVGVSLDSGVLTVTGNRDETEDYAVELKFEDINGEKGTTMLEGFIYNLVDMSGVLENNEEDAGEQGIIRVYYQDLDDYIPLEIDKIYQGDFIDADLGKIETTPNGNFSFQINEKASELEEVILQARIGTAEDYIGYVRTIELSGDDNSDVLVRAVPYAPYTNDPGIFRQFMLELSTNQPNTRFDFDGEYLGGLPGFESFNGFEKIRILDSDHFSAGTFTLQQQNFIKNKILNQDDINGLTPGQNWIRDNDIMFGNDITFTDYTLNANTQEIIPRQGVIVVVPRSTLGSAGRTETYKKGTLVYKGTIYLTPGAGSDGKIISHEFGHMFIGTGHPISMASDQTVMSITTTLSTTGSADKKTGKLIYEQTFMIFPPLVYPRVDYLHNILGPEFYGESQGSGLLSENYVEYEEEDKEIFTEEQQDLTEIDIDSLDYNNADTLYEETIYLQSDIDKNSIVKSISNIIREVISFIGGKIKSVFAS